MTSTLIQKLSECKELRSILETTVTEVGQSLDSYCCQILLANPLDPNSALICEGYSQTENKKPDNQSDLPSTTLPLVLNGRSFGSLTLTRKAPWSTDEINSTNLLIAKLSELIRQAQINDIVQRETFRVNFLVEISNLMSYSIVIGDALFMVVNILGKAIRASRCLFVCTDDKTAGWKCYEFWQQDKVKSCQEYHWPTNDSSLIAQTLRSRSPLKFYEGQEYSYLTPAQAELQFSGTRSLLALPLLHEDNVYGCVIIQQCDYRRDWTRDEIDMVQHTADKVAKALASLPEEKRIHKPIMKLHQRTVAPTDTESSPTGAALIQSLKGAFGQKSIPNANETSTLEQLPVQDLSASRLNQKTAQPEATVNPQPPSIKPAKRTSGISSKLGALKTKQGFKEENFQPSRPVEAPSIVPVKTREKKEREAAQSLPSDNAQPSWGNLDDIPTPAAGPAMSGLGMSMMPRVKAQSAAQDSPLRASLHKDKAPPADGAAEEQEVSASTSPADMSPPSTDSPDVSKAAPATLETEEEAKAKLERALAAKEKDSQISDYIFAIPNMDPRILGRIVNWVEEIEKKDKYLTAHATTVAEYSCAIAEKLKLSPREIEDIKVAALLHDVGKLGTSAEILQKRDDDLDDAELLTIMRHPMDGAELLKSVPDLISFASIVLAHHEEYGGNGYPQGLKGEEIPLPARIIFTANSYHGMVSDMCYGKGMSADEAQKHLREGAGQQYDPTVVDAFISYLQKTTQ